MREEPIPAALIARAEAIAEGWTRATQKAGFSGPQWMKLGERFQAALPTTAQASANLRAAFNQDSNTGDAGSADRRTV